MARQGNLQVVVFTDTFLETNGVGSYYRTVLEWSRKTEGIDVTVVCPTRDDLGGYQARDGVIPVRPAFPFRNPVYNHLTLGYFPQSKLGKIVNEIPSPKVIHIATSGALGFAAAILANRLKLPVVGCYHTDLQRYGKLYGRSLLGAPGEWLGGLIARFCDGLAYARCEALCFPSESAAETAKRFFHGRAELIPNPIDVDWFRPATSREGPFRERYSRNGNVLAAVVGRVAKEKNLDQICELLESDTRVDTVFVGDGPYAATLKHRWGARVTGFLHGEDLRAAYQQADVLVQLSGTETFGLSLVEALACGLPAIVRRARGFVETIPPDNGVEILEPAELGTLADRCVALVHDEQRHRDYSRKARKLALQCGTEAVLPRFKRFHETFAR